jgi:hypothetical protein
MNRTDKINLLEKVFNQGNKDSLKSLSRPSCPTVLIFEPQSKGTFFDARLNPTLPKKYQNKVLSDYDIDTMLLASGNQTTFLIPDNGRD